MGRSIPSFRMLIDIEKSEWKIFKERLSDRKDKESLNKLFFIPKLYCHSLSNLSQPRIMDPILLSVIFQSFKEIDKVSNKSKKYTISKEGFDTSFQSEIRRNNNDDDDKVWLKDYHYARILEDWKEFSDCLSRDDESIFIEMLKACYDTYYSSINSYNHKKNENTSNNRKKSDFCINRITSLFMALFLYQQKQLELIKINQRLVDSYK